jgi:hypothetical protein
MSRSPKITLSLGLAAAAVVLFFPAAAHASTNVVPNPGFEQGGCSGNTPVICGWEAETGVIFQDTSNPHSGSASMFLVCGSCGASEASGQGLEAAAGQASWQGLEVAATDPVLACASIGPGAHPASFWYREEAQELVQFAADFYPTPNCTGASSEDSFATRPTVYGGWEQLKGALIAPPGTQSATFKIGVGTGGYSDDINVEDSVLTTPVVSSFSPSTGPVGTSVDLVGLNFTGATGVAVDGTPASYTVDSDSEIHATVPAGATTGPISVTTAAGTGSSVSSFAVTPTISSFTPTSGPVGTSVDIVGLNFTGATIVRFNESLANYTVDSDSEIHATVPAGATTGPILVTTPSGTGASSSEFSLLPFPTPPTISSLTPTSGPVGTSVDVLGSSFTGATSVRFNGAPANYTVESDSEIHATVPAGATTGPISVTTSGGTATSSFTVILPPTITNFSPSSGRVGQQVTITGSNFTGATSVKLGTAPAKFTVNSPTKITATVPTIAHGSYKWSITTPAGIATSTSSFHVI